MRKHIIYFILFSIIISSCSDLLEVEADGTISGDVLIDEESIQKALNGAYYNFSGIADGSDGGELIGGDFILIPMLLSRRSDDIFSEVRWESVLAPQSYLDFVNKNILETNGRVEANWRRAYETINVVNSIESNIDNVSDGTERNRILGEALAIRGVLYFEMVQLWAPYYAADGINPETEPAIFIRTEPINDIEEIPNQSAANLSSIAEVYDQAEKDLTDASTLLEPFGKNGTNLSYYACQSYLTRLYMQKRDWESAVDAADNVINSGEFSLVADPRDAFNNVQNTSEDIFAIQQTLANNAGDRTTGIGVTAFYSSLQESGLGTLGIFRSSLTSSFLINSPQFAANDLRGTIDVSLTEDAGSSQITTAFYRNLTNDSDELLSPSKYLRGDHVLPVIRLAEIYLSRSEANFEFLGGVLNAQSLGDLNMVRTRAGLDELETGDFVDDIAFYDSLVLERKRELLYEGHLLQDLKRWRFFNVTDEYFIGLDDAGLDPWDERFILPIPQSEVNTWED